MADENCRSGDRDRGRHFRVQAATIRMLALDVNNRELLRRMKLFASNYEDMAAALESAE